MAGALGRGYAWILEIASSGGDRGETGGRWDYAFFFKVLITCETWGYVGLGGIDRNFEPGLRVFEGDWGSGGLVIVVAVMRNRQSSRLQISLCWLRTIVVFINLAPQFRILFQCFRVAIYIAGTPSATADQDLCLYQEEKTRLQALKSRTICCKTASQYIDCLSQLPLLWLNHRTLPQR